MKAYSFKGLLHTDGEINCTYPLSVIGNSYYITVLHHNSLETWSSAPVSFPDTINNYDFTTAASQAFNDGLNDALKDLGSGVWGIYNGDVQKDSTVDIYDMTHVDNISKLFLTGYFHEDINGDGRVDIYDMSIIDNNNELLLYFARPY